MERKVNVDAMEKTKSELSIVDFVPHDVDFSNLLQDKRGDHVRIALAHNPHLTDSQIHTLIDNGSDEVKKALANHKNLKSDHIDKLIKHNSDTINWNLARRSDLNDDHIHKLLDTKSTVVHLNLAKNRHLKFTDDHIEKFNQKSRIVKSELKQRPELKGKIK